LLKEQLWITDGGFHPGLPGAMLRSVCEQGSKDKQAVTEAHVFGLISYNWNNLSANLANETMEEFVVEMKDFEGKVFSDGNWKNQGSAAFFHPITVDFGEPFGNKPCVAMYLDELEDIPCQYPSLRETGFYIAGFHWFIDWFIMPCILLMLIIFPSSQKSTSRLLLRSFQTFCGPPFKTILKTKASTGSSLIVSHKDAYSLTGIPAAATMVQYVQGKFIASKGLNFQASIVATAPFFEDMRQMGASVEVR
jgi:saccharopine dehydrogenase (NAD+, L-lysine-forming)